MFVSGDTLASAGNVDPGGPGLGRDTFCFQFTKFEILLFEIVSNL